MLHIILGILKILGIIVLVLLGLLLLILLTTLFVPLRYQARVDFDGSPTAKAAVTWLCRLISVQIEYQKKLNFRVRVLRFYLIGGEKQKKTAKAHRHKKKAKASQIGKDKARAIEPKPEAVEDTPMDLKSEEKADESALKMTEDVKTEEVEIKKVKTEDVKTPETIRDPEKKSWVQRLRKLLDNGVTSVKNFGKSMKNLRDTVGHIRATIDTYRTFWNLPRTQAAYGHVKKELFYLLRHILPRKWKGNVHFGFEDPASTGQALALLSILEGCSGNHIQATADFDQKILEGDFYLKGHVRSCHFVKSGLSLLADKNVRRTVQRFRRTRGS
ncbi:MAG: DUF2953 domain-containing protein [Eubacteriales bacterium]|nr:DUF2953 domain-containing protein [Eubacteriales bacterium]